MNTNSVRGRSLRVFARVEDGVLTDAAPSPVERGECVPMWGMGGDGSAEVITAELVACTLGQRSRPELRLSGEQRVTLAFERLGADLSVRLARLGADISRKLSAIKVPSIP